MTDLQQFASSADVQRLTPGDVLVSDERWLTYGLRWTRAMEADLQALVEAADARRSARAPASLQGRVCFATPLVCLISVCSFKDENLWWDADDLKRRHAARCSCRLQCRRRRVSHADRDVKKRSSRD